MRWMCSLWQTIRGSGHRARLAEYCRELTASTQSRGLRGCERCRSCLRGTPLTLPYFYSAELDAKSARRFCERSYDRIFVYCSAMAQYVESTDGIPVITDLVMSIPTSGRSTPISHSFRFRQFTGGKGELWRVRTKGLREVSGRGGYDRA